MRLASVGSGDIVLVSKGGRRFHAHVKAVTAGVVEVVPIDRGISYRHASAREVLEVWQRRRRRTTGDEGTDTAGEVAKGQLSLAGRLDPPPAA